VRPEFRRHPDRLGRLLMWSGFSTSRGTGPRSRRGAVRVDNAAEPDGTNLLWESLGHDSLA
jgi:hypothetical protein